MSEVQTGQTGGNTVLHTYKEKHITEHQGK